METPTHTDPPVALDRLVLPLPDAPGWWWCKAKEGYQPGDELCVDVSIVEASNYPGVIVHYGRDCDYIRPEDPIAGIGEWFYDMEWVKADSPWQNVSAVAPATLDSALPKDVMAG